MRGRRAYPRRAVRIAMSVADADEWNLIGFEAALKWLAKAKSSAFGDVGKRRKNQFARTCGVPIFGVS